MDCFVGETLRASTYAGVNFDSDSFWMLSIRVLIVATLDLSLSLREPSSSLVESSLALKESILVDISAILVDISAMKEERRSLRSKSFVC